MGNIKDALEEQTKLTLQEDLKETAKKFEEDMRDIANSINAHFGIFQNISKQMELLIVKVQTLNDNILTMQTIEEEVE